MLVFKSSANRRASQPKHKAACDQCNASKVKCPGGGPRCKRCADSSQHCHYSLARRFGKPPGSKNKKTLEKARQAKEGNLEGNNGAGGGCFIPQNNGSRDDGAGTLDGESERWEGDESLDRLQTSSSTSFWPISPLINYPAFPDASQFIPSPEQDFFDGHHNVPLDGGDGSVIHSADPKLPDVEGLRRVESRRTWADDPDEYWNSSSPSIDQQLSSGPADTDSPLSEYSHSSTNETHMLISLDTVAARLEETAGSTITRFEQRQPTLCRCLRNYADVLCKLQTIENRQRPVQVDTLLTCANLVLNMAEKQLKCTQCLYDSCVAMQLIMIFQTIFTWSQDQCHPSGTPGPDLRVTLGQHEMTEDEYNFVKTALISKALDRTSTLLKLIMSRIEHVAWNRQGLVGPSSVPATPKDPPATPASVPGVRPSPSDGRPTTSTGTQTLDDLLAGHAGLALGNSLLIEENGTTDFAGALLRYYAAEGVVQGHRVHVVGVGEQWGRELPGLVGVGGAGGKENEAGAAVDKEKMKIAWRYERLGEFGAGTAGSRATPTPNRNPISSSPGQSDSTVPAAFCHSFDLTKRLSLPSTGAISFTAISSAAENPFTSILQSITQAIASSPPHTIHRLIIPTLLSPALFPPSASDPRHLLPFLHSLRALLRHHCTRLSAMLTLPLALYPRSTGLVCWIERLCDGVLELAPFPHSINDIEPPLTTSSGAGKVEEKPQGMLKIHRLPVLTEKGGGGGGGDDLAFSLSRKRFVIKPFSLPPVEGDQEAQKGEAEGGKVGKGDIEF